MIILCMMPKVDPYCTFYQIFSFAGKIFVEMHEMYKRGLALASNIEICLKFVKSPWIILSVGNILFFMELMESDWSWYNLYLYTKYFKKLCLGRSALIKPSSKCDGFISNSGSFLFGIERGLKMDICRVYCLKMEPWHFTSCALLTETDLD